MSNFLQEPTLRDLEVGSPEFFARQKEIIQERPLLKKCYDEWYERLIKDSHSAPGDGLFLELGSGGSCLKEFEPRFITSDVVPAVAERVIDGCDLPFEDSTLNSIALTHVLHHIPDLHQFFAEAVRTLQPGGVVTMIEVAHTPFAKFFFSRFHPEPYDDERDEWAFNQKDSMMDSNQALSWMVFVRDREKFEKLYPELHIEVFNYMPWLSYLVAGGVTKKDIVPKFMVPIIGAFEWMLKPLRPLLALHWHIRVRKVVDR